MFSWFVAKLEKEWKMIKAAPISFACACVLAFCISIMICFSLFETSITLNRATIQDYKERLSDLQDAAKSGASKSGQSVIYSNNPNTENLRPSDTNAAGFAYGDGGDKPLYTWSVKTQSWK
jgi:hypothetical protein